METMNQLRKTIKTWDEDLHEQNVGIPDPLQKVTADEIEMANGCHHFVRGEIICANGGSGQGQSPQNNERDSVQWEEIIDFGSLGDVGRDND